ncbi:acyl-CoA dehydrogenase family protein [Staphylococcus massiliensis]|uniref:Acyl-CoA dehydrogenase n=1 Tax=Staphylococcus massiliensis S46 TaxID=1229783 RepID=K9AVW6_9STAP|nr:acyl-CoA dehydrogenase family protein [Staphylococcus massiliensis]EKU50241.1 acyl-CoA dehydrogenase [Staphylococcus massiliensis S46]PNZ99978.1 acyl-CoA dehydrogenase [Staphylococcus massiliensis CCUG 55927]
MTQDTLTQLIESDLEPYVKEIDNGSYYPESFIKSLFKAQQFTADDFVHNLKVIEKVGETCLTTAFCIWCQWAFTTYLKHSSHNSEARKLYDQVFKGDIIGATGLSNPMKSFSDLEKVNLNHYYKHGELYVNGTLPAISNIQSDHYFGAISQDDETNETVMMILKADQEGVSISEMSNFLGVNGSATYRVNLDNVQVPSNRVLSKDAKAFASAIRPEFILLQIPIALGAIQSSLNHIESFKDQTAQSHVFIEYNVEKFHKQFEQLHQEFYEKVTAHLDNLDQILLDAVRIKKELGYLLLEINQAAMVYGGSRAYIEDSKPAIKLKEGFFFAALTPTLRHLGKLEQELG